MISSFGGFYEDAAVLSNAMQVVRYMVGSTFNSLDHVKHAVFKVCEFIDVWGWAL